MPGRGINHVRTSGHLHSQSSRTPTQHPHSHTQRRSVAPCGMLQHTAVEESHQTLNALKFNLHLRRVEHVLSSGGPRFHQTDAEDNHGAAERSHRFQGCDERGQTTTMVSNMIKGRSRRESASGTYNRIRSPLGRACSWHRVPPLTRRAGSTGPPAHGPTYHRKANTNELLLSETK